ncbi:MAG: Cna B-type domain-containing protein, partial [Anaerolineaceae bacterium]|nr:Cna B-type domain-containing protein [Anaerolineaceae bacterium]
MKIFRNLYYNNKKGREYTDMRERNRIFSHFFFVFILTILLGTCVSTVFSQDTSSNLNDFLESVSINATQKTDGTYDIKEGKQYTVSLQFKEIPNGLQFPDNGAMTFTLPNGFEEIFEKTDTSSITITDFENGQQYIIQGNPYTIGTSQAPGTITFNWNQGTTPEEQEAFQKLKNATNVQFNLNFTGIFDKNQSSISFSSGVNVNIDVDTEHSLDLQKTASSFDPNTGIIEYNLVVKSHGINKNVVVTDQITGSGTMFATELSDWITCYGNNNCYSNPKPVTVSSDGKTFTYDFGNMDDGNEIHITYKAKLTGDGLDPTADKGKIPEGITNNTYNAKSDEDPTPTPPAPLDYHNNSYITFNKNGVYSSDNETITWTIDLNQAKLTSLAGTMITDTIDSGSREILNYSGNGIHIAGTCSNNTTVSRDVTWAEVGVTNTNNDYNWSYTFPSGADNDGACSYTITYTTKADTSNLYQSENIVKNTAEYLEDSKEKKVNVVPSSPVTFEKTAASVTGTEATWALSIFLPANKSFDSIELTDVFPNRNNYYFDTFKQGSLSITSESNGVETQLQSETDYTITEPSTQFTITFMNPVLQSQTVDRTIKVTFTTTFDPKWIEDAKNQSYLRDHINNATLKINDNIELPDDETVTPLVIEVEKSGSNQYNSNNIDPVEITEDGKTFELPVYRFEIRISGVTTDTIEITDDFNTNILEVYTGNLTFGNNIYNQITDNLKIYGGDNIYQIQYGESPVVSSPTANGAKFTVTVPKNGENYYTYYKFAYYLKVKNKAAFTELSRLAVTTDPTNRTYTLNNTATFNGVNDDASVTYTYSPLSKELTNKSSLNNNERRAQYKITYNPTGQEINGGNDITLTDTFSENLVILYNTIEFDNPDAVVTYTVSGYTATYVIKDSSPVTITYDAIVIGTGNLTLTNTVTAQNSDFGNSEESHTANFSAGQGSIPYISILKAEKNDMLKPLSGAKFELYECDTSTVICSDPTNCTGRADCQNPVPVKYFQGTHAGENVVVTTDEDGIALLDNGNDVNLVYNRKYYLLETVFPTGYKGDSTNTSNKWFFTIFEQPQERHADVWVYPTGYTLRVWNESKTTKINLEKSFSGGVSPSTLTNEQKDAITFTIERVPDVDDNDGFPKTIKYSQFTNGKYEIDGLTIGTYTITENVPDIDGYTLTKTYKIDDATVDNVTGDSPLTVTITSDDVVNHENNISHTVSITNNFQNEGGTTSVTATKAWSNNTAPTDASVVFTLYANHTQAGSTIIADNTVTLDGTAENTVPTVAGGYESAPWVATFVNLPAKDGTTDITYTVAETIGWPGYTASTNQPVENGGTITNTEITGELSLSATKSITSWPADNREFTFTLSGLDNSGNNQGNAVAKLSGFTTEQKTQNATNTAPTVTFGPISFGASDIGKEFTFRITETEPAGTDTNTHIYRGVTYDPDPHTVIVTPKLSGNNIAFDVSIGGSTSEYSSGGTVPAATITNSYNASGTAAISITKALGSGSTWPTGGEVEFTLTRQTEGAPMPTDANGDKVTLNSATTGNFGNISYNENHARKQYVYVITETKGFDGWANSGPVTATVTVGADDGSGTLSTSVTYSPENHTITNTENAANISLKLTKSINPWPTGRIFEFTLTGDNSKLTGVTTTGTVQAGSETLTFRPIQFSASDLNQPFIFTVNETYPGTDSGNVYQGVTYDRTGHTVTIKPVLSGTNIAFEVTIGSNAPQTYQSGSIVENAFEFTNTYNVSGTAALKIKKELAGTSEWPTGKSVIFTLSTTDDGPLPDNKTVTLNSATEGTFDAIPFDSTHANHTYHYTITETTGFGNGWTISSPVTATVRVGADNGTGTLQTTVTYSPDTDTITNSKISETSVTLSGTKKIKDGTTESAPTAYQKWDFTLTAEDGGPLPNATICTPVTGSTNSCTVTNNGENIDFGSITFDYTHLNTDNPATPKEYKYKITEAANTSSPQHVVIDETGKEFTISVSLVGSSVVAKVNDSTSAVTTFNFGTLTNTKVNPGSIVFEATKKMAEGSVWPEGKKFKLVLAADNNDANATQKLQGLTGLEQEVARGPEDTATAEFPQISFTSADAGKEFKFKVTETNDGGTGITYSTAEHKISVKPVLISGGILEITASVDSGDYTTVTDKLNVGDFVNSYTVSNTSLVLSATKSITPWPKSASSENIPFKFHITDAESNNPKKVTEFADATTSGATAPAVFAAIPFTQNDIDKTFTFDITEVPNSSISFVTYSEETKSITVKVLDNGDGTLKLVDPNTPITSTSSAPKDVGTFTNTYKATGTAILKITKALGTGDTWPTNGNVTFTLTPITANAPMPAEDKRTVTLSAPGTGSFGEITYSLANNNAGVDYQYRIEETSDFGSEWTKTGPITATVSVGHDMGTGTLTTTVTYSDSGTTSGTITNHKIQPAEVVISGTKSLTGKTITSQKWDFQLNSPTTGAPLPSGCTSFPCVIQNDGQSFKYGGMTFTSAHLGENQGENTYYTYIVTEQKATNSPVNVTIDPNSKTFTVTVSLENGDVKAVVKANDTPLNPTDGAYNIGTFTNTEVEAGSIRFTALKLVNNNDNSAWPKDAAFTLVLTADNNDENAAAKLAELSTSDRSALTQELNDSKRTAQFPVLPFSYTDASANKEFKFAVSETRGTKGGYTYDNTVHHIVVTPRVDTDGDSVILNVTVDGTDKTNEITNNVLSVGSFNNTYASSGSITLSAQKSINRWPDGQTFSFQIADADSNSPKKIDVSNAKKTASSPDTPVKFDDIDFDHTDAGKDFKFIISEVDKNLTYVDYDSKTFTITVSVADNGDGTLVFTVKDAAGNPISLDTVSSSYIAGTFTNTYQARGSVTLKGQKKVVDEDNETAETHIFHFILRYDDEHETTQDITGRVEVKEDNTYFDFEMTPINYTLAFVKQLETAGHAKPVSGAAKPTWTITYRIEEDQAANAQETSDVEIDFDHDHPEVIVKIVDEGNGTLTCTQETPISDVSFDNHEIHEGSYTINAVKRLNGRPMTDADQWTFTLTAVAPTDAPMPEECTTGTACTENNNKDGLIQFSPIHFTPERLGPGHGEKQYKYKLTESRKSGVNYAGVTDDSSLEREFTLTVHYNEEQNTVTVTSDKDNFEGGLTGYLTFNNSYQAQGTAKLSVEKKMAHGYWPTNAKFTFELRESPNNDPQKYSGSKTITIDNKDNPTDSFADINFTQADLGKTFSFAILENASGIEGITDSRESYTVAITPKADGTNIRPDAKITKNDGSDPITITPQLESGKYTIAVGNFTNSYEASGSVKLSVTKAINLWPKDAQFGFRIEDDKENNPKKIDVNNNSIAVVKPAVSTDSPETNSNTFPGISFNREDIGKTFIFNITEINNNITGVTYSTEKLVVKVTVSDYGNSKLKFDVTDGSGNPLTQDTTTLVYDAGTITNKYEASGSIDLQGYKQVEDTDGDKSEERIFSFTLNERDKNDGTGDVVATASNFSIKDGEDPKPFKLSRITYDLNKLDRLVKAGKAERVENASVPTWNVWYWLTEDVINDVHDREIEFDTHKTKITVTITGEGNGSLICTQSPEAAAIKYINHEIHEGAVTVSGKKNFEGRDPRSGESWTFTLTPTGSNAADAPMPENCSSPCQVQNTGSSFTFGTIHFTAENLGPDHTAKEYTYKVEESAPAANSGWSISGEASKEFTVKVELDAEENIKVTKTPDDLTGHLTFTNKYEASGSIRLSARKLVSGAYNGQTFTLRLQAAPGAVNAPIKLRDIAAEQLSKQVGKDQLAEFPVLSFNIGDCDKDFTFVIDEVTGTDPNMIYSDTKFTVVITPQDNGNGTITPKVKINNAEKTAVKGTDDVYTLSVGDIDFTNRYITPASLQFSAKKLMKNGNWPTGEQTFIIKLDPGVTGGNAEAKLNNLSTEDKAKLKQTVSNSDTVTFPVLEFTKDDAKKEFTFIVSEDSENGYPYITYSEKRYVVKVVPSIDTDNKVALSVLIDNQPVTVVNNSLDTFEFENEYTTEVKLTLKSSKKIVDKDGITTESHELPFELWYSDDYTKFKGGDETVKPIITRTINVVDGETPKPFDYPIRFTTEPLAEPVDGLESLPDMVDAGKATLSLDGRNKLWTVNYVLDEKTVVDRELKPPDQTFEIQVEIEDNGQGKLFVKALRFRDMNKTETYTIVTGTGTDGLDFSVGTFENTERTSAAPITISGNKKLTGRTMTNDDVWIFTITGSENAPLPTNAAGEVVSSVQNTNGSFSFAPITFTPQHLGECSMTGNTYTCASKVYTYTVTETNTKEGGIDGVDITDAEPISFNVTVSLNDEGNIQVSLPENLGDILTFENIYKTKPVSVQFSGRKTLENYPQGQTSPVFTYTLSENGSVLQTITTNGSGDITFDVITYATTGTHTYTIEETVGDAYGIVYDRNIYTAEVTISDDGHGQLQKSVTITDSEGNTVNENGINFTNRYSTATVQFSGRKTLENYPQGQTAPVFTYTLSENGTVIQSITTNGSGDIIFDAITYATTGTHTYTIEETVGDAYGIVYDRNVYTSVVMITADNLGRLQKSVIITDSEGNTVNEDGINFTNRYNVVSIQFGGYKSLQGRKLKNAEFSFRLLDEDGNLIELVRNDGTGKFTFSTLFFTEDQIGTHIYIVRETIGNADDITYDYREYKITVKVSKNIFGELIIKATEDSNTPLDKLNFENQYHMVIYRITPTTPTLPETGFSAVRPQTLPEKPLSLNYRPTSWILQIPTLDVITDIVVVPSENGSYPVTWLGYDGGLLEGYSMPGQGPSVITGHNHL